MNYNKITIITPTFNRAKELVKLHQSIVSQEYPNVEWIISNDGSTDDTCNVVEGLSACNGLKIKLLTKENGGKLSAQCLAYPYIDSEFFFVVDSDDWLYEGALHAMNNILNEYSDNYDSFVFHRIDPDSRTYIGDLFNRSYGDYYDIMNYISGDKVHLLRSDFFLSFKGVIDPLEKYISVSQIYTSIADLYRLKCFNLPMVYCKYMDSGLTRNLVGHRRSSPNNSRYTYSLIFSNASYRGVIRLRALINYYRFSFPYFLLPDKLPHLPFYLVGCFFYLYDSIKERP